MFNFSIRTRALPVMFAFACSLFAILFIVFYIFVFDSIDQIFARKNTLILDETVNQAKVSEEIFRRSAKRLHKGRGVQRQFAKTAAGDRQLDALLEAQETLQIWFKQQDQDYHSATYLNQHGEPVIAIDFAEDLRRSLGNATFTQESNNTNAQESRKVFQLNPQIAETWPIAQPPQLGTYTLVLPGRDVVFRTVYSIADRKTQAINGFLALDRPLKSVVPWVHSEGESLVIIDKSTSRIIYDSLDLENSNRVFAEQYPELAYASYTESDESIPPYAKVSLNDSETLVIKIDVGEVGWQFIHTTALNPFIRAPKERGRLLVMAALIFVLVAGGAIYILTNRVRRRSLELEKANEIVSQHSDLLEQELQTAHEMQMWLMPQSNPEVAGYEVVGLCRPATQVGGDFFQYFSVGQDKWVFALADVTGHGMQAAIPTMVFSGLLHTEISYSPTPETLMPKLNTSLCRVLEPRTFVCLALGELDRSHNTMRISNGGCPYPYIYRSAADSIEEVALSAFPLGVRASSSYDVSEVTLSEGDVVVFCSDGIVEAMSESGEPFGFERLAHLILQAGSKSESAECIIDNLFKELDAFSIGHEQDDDQTVVVVRAQGRLAAT